MKLRDIADYVTDKISSDAIDLECYVTTDSLLQNKVGRETASNLPPQTCTLTFFRKGDVLISNIRPYLKKVWMADVEGGCNADVLVLRAKDGHTPEFLYALLLQDAFYEYAMKGAKGSKMPRGDKAQIMRYEIPTLSSSEDSIGKFIVSINDKIATNRKINRNLEAMARQLYDYWFVQFDFPDENCKPYKSSGGKMVWNERLKREIPEKWTNGTMRDFLKICNGRDHKQLNGGDIPVYGTGGFMRGVDTALYKGESVLLPRKGSLTNFMLVNEAFWTVDTMFYTQELMTGAAKYVYYGLSYHDITRFDSGTGVPSMTSIAYYAFPFVKPTDTIIWSFNQMIEPILSKKRQIEVEIKALIQERDTLLPLLMNGQVSVMPIAVNCDLSHD